MQLRVSKEDNVLMYTKFEKDGSKIVYHEIYCEPKNMTFDEKSFAVGGKMVVPHSFVNKKEAGEIIGITKLGVNLAYYKGTPRQQVCFYTFGFLNNYYGNELNDKVPF